MQIYSNTFADVVNCSKELYFKAQKFLKNFEKEEIIDVLYFCSMLSKVCTKTEYLTGITRLVEYIALDDILNLKEYEIIQLMNTPLVDIHTAYLNL